MKRPKKYYYHFTNGNKLRDGRKLPRRGVWLKHEGPLQPCARGLHASADAYDALAFASGVTLHRVELRGKMLKHGNPVDKLCARERKIVQSLDATKLLQEFACRVALDVIHLWKAPEIVKEFLHTGKKEIAAAAAAAAVAASNAAYAANAVSYAADAAAYAAAASNAAYAANAVSYATAASAYATYAANAAFYASDAAAYAANTANTANAASNAADAAARNKYREWFGAMVEEAFAKQKDTL